MESGAARAAPLFMFGMPGVTTGLYCCENIGKKTLTGLQGPTSRFTF
jgi:hypothetical protein